MRQRWLRFLLAVVGGAGLVVALIGAGRWARVLLDARQHYDVAVAEIDVAPPPGIDRQRFLSEVQYLGNLPERVSGMDPAMVLRVAAAFAAHPWVESVETVSLRSADGPRARLRLRSPVLAIHDRAVDRHGVLLPAGTSIEGLIAFHGKTEADKGVAGAPCADPDVVRAAHVVNLLSPFQDQLDLKDVRPEGGGFALSGRVHITWRSGGDESQRIAQLRERLAKKPLPERIDLNQ